MNQIEVSVVIPEERLTEFYVILGDWLSGKITPAEQAQPADGRRRGRRRYGARSPSASRYAGISQLLKELEGPVAEVSFEDLEKAIGNDLPASAEKHRAWWANTERNTQARVWMEEGWRVDSVDFDTRMVNFSRI